MPRFAPTRLDAVPLAHYRQMFDREVRAAAILRVPGSGGGGDALAAWLTARSDPLP